MWVEALLAKDDLNRAITDFCPLKINLEKGGNLVISDPCNLELIAGVGLRMSVTVEVHWPILGIQIPVSVRSATLDVRPQILAKQEGEVLTFKLHLDDVDLSMVPEFVDRGIVDLVNAELEAKHVELSWSFMKTLSHVFALPDALASASGIHLRAMWGRVKITDEAIVLAVSFRATVEPPVVGPELSAPAGLLAIRPPHTGRPGPLEPETILSSRRRRATGVALVGGAIVLAGLGLSALALACRRPQTFFDRWRGLFGT
jgi:hypothetical protein